MEKTANWILDDHLWTAGNFILQIKPTFIVNVKKFIADSKDKRTGGLIACSECKFNF
jgi:hypothetical protein